MLTCIFHSDKRTAFATRKKKNWRCLTKNIYMISDFGNWGFISNLQTVENKFP